MRTTSRPFALAALAAALSACPPPEDPTLAVDLTDSGVEAPAPILGTFTDEFGTTHTIDESRWVQTYPGYDPLGFDLVAWDVDLGIVVAHNDPTNVFDPDRWSRFEWAEAGEHVYYCQTVFGAASEADAAAAPPADAGDLDAGCGGFPWTDLTP